MTATFAMFEVRITPLILGVPGIEEFEGGTSVIAIEDTIEVTQFSDLEVEHIHNEGRTASIKLSCFDPIVEALEPLEQALWIGFWRPGENVAEGIFYGQCTINDDFDDAEGKVELVAADPLAGKARRHYIRRGDPALNIDPERGSLPNHAESIATILKAACNTPSQQSRAMPALALGFDQYADPFNTPAAADAATIEIQRGQQVTELVEDILRDVNGPDMDVRPAWWFPTNRYADIWLYAPPGDPESPGPTGLGRNLDPVDPNDPQPGEVIFEYGIGLDTCSKLTVEPGEPTTHAHYLDKSRRYRATSTDVASSQKIGAWVSFNTADFTIQRAHRSGGTVVKPDVTPLKALADTIVKAYGRPPRHITLTLRPPDHPGMPQYGHPDWPWTVPSGIERIGGSWYIGDWVRVRGIQGYRSVNELARITKVTLSQGRPEDLPRVDVELVPAVTGEPSDDLDYPAPDEAPTVTVTMPAPGATLSGTVELAATAMDDVAIASVDLRVDGNSITGGFDTSAPYSVLFDTTTLTDGAHVITATARDTAGNSTTSTPVNVTVDNTP